MFFMCCILTFGLSVHIACDYFTHKKVIAHIVELEDRLDKLKGNR